MYSLKQALMDGQSLTELEAVTLMHEMAEQVMEGADPDDVLHDEGLEPDYVFDLLDLCSTL